MHLLQGGEPGAGAGGGARLPHVVVVQDEVRFPPLRQQAHRDAPAHPAQGAGQEVNKSGSERFSSRKAAQDAGLPR